ncbi:MAG TPA: putative zinc-binding protein [Thermodesulfobacteriota bacterium]|nr:putative zinc-binding protein [Thermodesulfobacteriota bacterium]
MKKVLLYPCGGVGLVVSTVTRLASLKAMEELLPEQMELLDMHRCQRGAPDEIALLEKYPVIVMDGCQQQCGSYFLNMLGIKPAARLYTPGYIAKTKLKPGKCRAQLEKEGQQLADTMAAEAVAVAKGILKGPYQFKKQKVKRKNLVCCDYSQDIEEALAYDEVNPRVHRPKSMPALPGLEESER